MNNNIRFSRLTLSLLAVFLSTVLLLSACTGSAQTTAPVITTTTTTQSYSVATSPVPSTTVTTTQETTAVTTTQTTPVTPAPAGTVPDISSLTLLSVLSGTVWVKLGDSDQWNVIERGLTLSPGDSIRAGSDSSAQVIFFDGSIIELDPDTIITVAELGLSDTGSTTIHLKQEIGRTVSRVQKLADTASSYEIETRAAVAAVRGSTMIVEVYPDGTTTVTNVHGDIRVTAQGVEVVVPEDKQSTVQVGQVPGEPETIPTPAPTTTTPVVPDYFAVINTAVHADRAVASIGDTIHYTYTIANAGNMAFNSISVTDSLTGMPSYVNGDSDSDSILDPSETWSYAASHIVTAADPSPLVNTAAFSAITANGQQVMTQDQAQVTITGMTVVITSPADGATITTHTVDITGTVSDVSVTQATVSINGASHAIAVSNGSFSTNENVNNGSNTIVVTVNYGEGQTASDSVTVNVEIESFALRIELTWDTDGTDLDAHLVRPGGDFGDSVDDCYYSNENPDWGTVQVTADNPSLDQDDTDGYGPENITLQTAADAGVYEYMVHYYDGAPSTTATVRIWIDNVLVTELTQTLEYDDVWDVACILNIEGTLVLVTPGITVVKTAGVEMAHVGDNITYSYQVSNSGNISLYGITLSDDILGDVTAMTGGDVNENGYLDTTEVWTFYSWYVVTGDDSTPLVNTAAVSGNYSINKSVTDTDTASVQILKPAINVSIAADKTEASPEEDVTYTCNVTNTGNTALGSIEVLMSLDVAVVYTGGDTNLNGHLDIGETWTYSATYSVYIEDQSPLVNTVTASGLDALEELVSDEDSASVLIPS